MFTSNIGRMRFFFYSLGATFLEVVAALVCIAGTIGFEGLVNSKPGPGREELAMAILVASMAIVLLRANFAWRRNRDAQGSKFILWSYIAFSALFAFLQACTVLVYNFASDDSNFGLNLMGFGLLGFWIRILVAKPAGMDINELTSVFDFEGAVPAGAGRMSGSAAPSTARAAAPAPRSAPSAQPMGRPRPAGFGKRGL